MHNFERYLAHGLSNLGSFEKGLYELIIKADKSNLKQLALGYPVEVKIYQDYIRG